MARPIQRRGATLKLGAREATMTLTATPILRTGVNIYCVNVNIFISNSVHLGNESTYLWIWNKCWHQVEGCFHPQKTGWPSSRRLQNSGWTFRLFNNFEIRSQIVIISILINYQVDPMDDRANLSYAALPERLYIVQDGQVVYQVDLRLEIFHQLKFVSFS